MKTPKSRPHAHDNSTLYVIEFLVFLLVLLAATSAAAGDPGGRAEKTASKAALARGEYLTTILGCGGCHTEGALERLPYGPTLAGSKIGIAYTDPESADYPGIVFPSNLTSHKTEGLGAWSRKDIARAIRNGVNHRGGEVISVMPWINYSLLSTPDTYDIVDYLRSLAPVAYAIPENLVVGEPSSHKYLRIGVYRFEPNQRLRMDVRTEGAESTTQPDTQD